MKKLLAVLAAIITPVTLFALPNYEPFADATGSGGTLHAVGIWVSQPDGGGTAGTGQKDATGGQWYHASASTANSSPTITAGNLQYPGVLPAPSGNKVLVGSTGANLAAGRYFHSSILKALTSGGTASRFYSFVLQASDISALGATGTWIAGFNNTAGTATTTFPTTIGGRTLVRSVNSNTGFQIGLAKAGETPTFGSSPQTFTTADTIFVVVEYVVNTGNTADDVANMWINPSVTTFANNAYKPTPTLTASAGTDMATSGSLQSFLLANSANSGQHYVDELRVAADWAGVTPSIITNQPSSGTTDYGQSASFSAGALAGSTYQWRKNDSDLTGETGTSLTLATVAQANEGSYTVVATLSGNSVTSAVATLTVHDPKVTSGPTIAPGSTVPPGSTVTFSATAIGSPTLTYQWHKGTAAVVDGTYSGTVISGANSATLTIAGVRAGGLGDGGSYTLNVTNANGRATTSSAVTLTVIDPTIISSPVSQTKNYTESVTFSVTVAGTSPPFTYTWRKNAVNITPDGVHVVQTDSGTTSTLTINNLTFADQAIAPGGYDVGVQDNGGHPSILSDVATLTVNDPAITVPVVSVITNVGATVKLQVQGASSGTLTYAWKTNGMAVSDGLTPWGSTISGATTATLTIAGVTNIDGKAYVAEVSGAGVGPAVSSTGTVSVVQITRQPTPASLIIGAGGKAVFSVGASITGPGTLTYQWHKTSGDISGATGSAISIVNAQPTDSDSYAVRVIYGPGSAFIDSGTASLTVSATQLQLASGNLVVARVGDGAQTLRDAGNSIYLDQFSPAGSYVNTVTIPDSGPDGLIARGTAGANIGGLSGMTTLTTSGDGKYLVLNGYRTNYDATSTLVLAGGSTPELSIPRAVATVDASSQYLVRIDALGGTGGANMAASAYRCAAFDGVDEYWGTTGSATVPVYYFGTQTSAGAITISSGNARIVNLFNGKFYACLANEGLYRFDGKPHPGDALTLDIAYTTTGGSGNCDFSVSPDGNKIYIADGRPWVATMLNTNGGIQVYTNNGSGGYPLARVLKPDPDSTLGALYVTVDYSQANPVVYATTIVASQNRLVKIVDDGSNSGAGTATVLATAGVNQEFRGLRFSPSSSALKASVTITSIVKNGNGTVTISYTGGSGSSFTLMKTINLNLTRDSWTPVGTNSSSTPGSFTITPAAGNEFYAVRSN
jgi:hypothetical protein